MRTVVIIGCADTKSEEMRFLKAELKKYGVGSILIDTSLRFRAETAKLSDIQTGQLLALGGYPEDALRGVPKNEAIEIVKKCLREAVSGLYRDGKICGGISTGGMQNSLIAAEGLRMLPFGVPKILVSSMANSYMSCEMFTGRTDLIIMPSVADVSGVNSITSAVYRNAAAALAGMVSQVQSERKETKEIAITSVGVTNDGVSLIAQRVKEMGYTPVFFHGTTGGARAMEDLILSGRFDAVFDLDVHDVLVEAIGYYVVNQSVNCRLERLKAADQPMVFSFSGMDVIDMPRSFFESSDIPQKSERKIFKHNENLYHVKVTKEEAVAGAKLLARRLNDLEGPVAVVAPLRGFRDNTQPGELLYDPDVDNAIIETVKDNLKPEIRFIAVDCNANDQMYADTVVDCWLKLKQRKE